MFHYMPSMLLACIFEALFLHLRRGPPMAQLYQDRYHYQQTGSFPQALNPHYSEVERLKSQFL